MTPEQDEQFKSYGCACRCLIVLAEKLGKPITKEKFIDRFSAKYPFWSQKKQCGVTNVGMIFEIAKDLDLAQNFTIFRDKNMVRDGLRKKHIIGLMLATEKRLLEDGKTWQEYYHCSLVNLSPPSDSSWAISQVDHNMREMSPQVLSDAYIDKMSGYFLVFMPEIALHTTALN